MLEVQQVLELSPHMRRIRLGGRELDGFPAGRDGAHIKVFLPRPGQAQPVLPEPGANGPVWPPPEQRPVTRTYSVRRYDPDTGLLDVDFVLHDDGIASAWARQARPGDRMGIAGPGGPDPMLGQASFYLLAGDLSALPAIGALLEKLPSSAHGQALIQVPDSADVQPLDHPEGVAVSWLHCRDPVLGGRRLAAWVERLEWPVAPCSAWVAGERSAVVAIRDHLRTVRGFDRRNLYAIPYWRAALSEEAFHEERHRIMDELAADAPRQPDRGEHG
ncbi:siderophore-interacting protein [Aquisalimonas lutea]|uniref:siderophore-interacting protein n=1 Tax=Aquisalimonas lutea TaxID=1327750 RepID=UPI0025B4A3FF|nr:siderophore-interacting protein [Aquisalimonas lutea]MDN3518857.1 siderophore-interacting protein [Aquisalimonas lutea]